MTPKLKLKEDISRRDILTFLALILFLLVWTWITFTFIV